MELVSIIATVFFGILSVVLSIYLYRRKKYPGKIMYVRHNTTDVVNSVADNFSEIKILYKNRPIDKKIVYEKGTFLNNGEIDLSNESIKVKLPNNYKWIEYRITNNSEGIICNTEKIDDSTIAIRFDLLKKEEFIQIEGLCGKIEENNESKWTELYFKHRIANTSKIEKSTLQVSEHPLIFTLLMIMMLFYLGLCFGMPLIDNTHYVYYKETFSQTDILYSAKFYNDLVVLRSSNSDKKISVTVEEFNKNYKAVNYELTYWESVYREKEMIALFFICFLGILFLFLKGMYKYKKDKKLFNLFNNKLG